MTAELDAWIISAITAHPGITLYELGELRLSQHPELHTRVSSPKQSIRSKLVKRLGSLVRAGAIKREKGPGITFTSCHKEVWHYYIAEGCPWLR